MTAVSECQLDECLLEALLEGLGVNECLHQIKLKKSEEIGMLKLCFHCKKVKKLSSIKMDCLLFLIVS